MEKILLKLSYSSYQTPLYEKTSVGAKEIHSKLKPNLRSI